jgi:hypothetical protein
MHVVNAERIRESKIKPASVNWSILLIIINRTGLGANDALPDLVDVSCQMRAI